jgi:hypothetical protein
MQQVSACRTNAIKPKGSRGRKLRRYACWTCNASILPATSALKKRNRRCKAPPNHLQRSPRLLVNGQRVDGVTFQGLESHFSSEVFANSLFALGQSLTETEVRRQAEFFTPAHVKTRRALQSPSHHLQRNATNATTCHDVKRRITRRGRPALAAVALARGSWPATRN